MTQNDRPLVSGRVFWRLIWPKLEAAGWESGLARDLEVGCRIYKPGMKACRKTAQPGEDFFLYNDYDHRLLDYILETGLVSAEDIWTPSISETQVQEHAEPPVIVPVAAIAAETAPAVGGPPVKKKGRAATPKKTPKTSKKVKRKRKAVPFKQLKQEMADYRTDAVETRQKTSKKKHRGAEDERVRSKPTQQAVVLGQAVESADGNGVTTSSEQGANYLECVEYGAQLLHDIELHMLQLVATVSRHRRVLCGVEVQAKLSGGSMDDAAELVADIQASQQDLAYEVDQLVGYLMAPTAVFGADERQRLGAQRFHPSSHEKLGFLREVNLHVMQFVATVRRRRRPFTLDGTGQSQCGAPHLLEDWNARVQSIAQLQDDLLYEANELANFKRLTVRPSYKGLHELKTPVREDGDITETDEEYAWLAAEEATEEEDEEEWVPPPPTPRGRKLNREISMREVSFP
ncbi:hypothetical protein PR003_g5202 [Phytophthora rubi]|uniref:Uncharacterized protein n=1 Tax=Phytophthora rubi TaxID=129364 RepID=A0A6A4G506_9STRA|nr:hypothetical protein PR003_g5202 [Phytophthora rubi]